MIEVIGQEGACCMAQLSDYLAAERTVLAWLRTGLALMGFGFVVARFGLFLQEIQFVQHAPAMHSSGLSLWLGTTLIIAGILVNALSPWHHVRLVGQLDRNESRPSHSPALATAVAIFLVLVGVTMAIYLLVVGGSSA
jgi:putative membrane protein